MRPLLLTILFLAILTGCQETSGTLLEPSVMEHRECDTCPEVSLHIPKAVGRTKLASTINTALEEEIISLLVFDGEMEVTTMEGAIQSFDNGYRQLATFQDELSPAWEAKINAEVVFEDDALLTIVIDSYLYTGGAHGYGSKRFLNFDKDKGKELENWELFNNREEFVRFAEAKFREQEEIPSDKSINHTGFMFERDSFYLPENIGFTRKGIQLLYNQYEVASYADGPIAITLPYPEVRKYLSPNIKS